jgi:hypothetical protein
MVRAAPYPRRSSDPGRESESGGLAPAPPGRADAPRASATTIPARPAPALLRKSFRVIRGGFVMVMMSSAALPAGSLRSFLLLHLDHLLEPGIHVLEGELPQGKDVRGQVVARLSRLRIDVRRVGPDADELQGVRSRSELENRSFAAAWPQM